MTRCKHFFGVSSAPYSLANDPLGGRCAKQVSSAATNGVMMSTMLLPAHQFAKPASLAEALTVLQKDPGQVRLLAGGTDVIFNMRGRLFTPDILLSLRDLPELQDVTELADGAVALGAGCRLTDLERHPLVARYPGLVAGFRAVASRHVRNMATLGGNLNLDTRCWYTNQTAEWRKAKGPCLKTGVEACHAIKSSPVCVALNASDTAPALLALDASAVSDFGPG